MNFFVRAIGFFNDAYDLFVMCIVNVILQEQYPPNASTGFLGYEEGGYQTMVSTAVFIGSVLGQLVFGYYADILGRKRIMVFTAVLLIVGGLLCTGAYAGQGNIASMLYLLTFYRFLLGFGIGGEYPLSSTYTAEGTTAANRGTAVSSTFSMQGIGQLAAALFGNILVQLLANSRNADGEYDKGNLEIIWRTLFGIGTLPCLLILYPRYMAHESTHFQKNIPKKNKGDDDYHVMKMESNKNGQTASSTSSSVLSSSLSSPTSTEFATLWLKISFILKNYGGRLLGTAGTWFLFDIVFYAQGIFSATVFKSLKVDEGEGPVSLQIITLQTVLLSFGALPGYFVAILTIDKIGRRNMQLQGFFFMTLIFFILGYCWENVVDTPAVFLILYALTFFFANFGPNTTTFLLPVEAFPTPLRATCHGFSAAMGKLGAVLGSSLFGPIERTYGLPTVFYLCALVCFVSLPMTWFFVQDRVGELELLDIELQGFLNNEKCLDDRNRLSNTITRDSGVHYTSELMTPCAKKNVSFTEP